MKDVEEKFHEALEAEEERIIYQRKLLLLNTRKLREKEIETMMRLKNSSLKNAVDEKEKKMETFLRAIEKQVMNFILIDLHKLEFHLIFQSSHSD